MPQIIKSTVFMSFIWQLLKRVAKRGFRTPDVWRSALQLIFRYHVNVGSRSSKEAFNFVTCGFTPEARLFLGFNCEQWHLRSTIYVN